MKKILVITLLLGAQSVFGMDAEVDAPGRKVIQADSTQDEELLKAVRDGNLEAVNQALDKGANPNAIDHIWRSIPVVSAATKGDSNVVLTLLEHKANVDGINGNGMTALMAACSNRRVEVVKVLLAHEANVYVQSYYNRSALDELNRSDCHPEIRRMLQEKLSQPCSIQ